MRAESRTVLVRNVVGLLLILSVAACGGSKNNNEPPLANAGADQSTNAGTTVTLSGATSSDPDGDMLFFAWTSTQAPAGGTPAITGANTATPSFQPQQIGDYQFTLTVSDGHGDSAQDTVTVHVAAALPPNHAPQVSAASVAAVQGQPSAISIAATDPDGDVLSYSIQSPPQHGTIENFSASLGTFNYRPATGYLGSDSVLVQVQDPRGLTASATITLSVNLPNAAPQVTLAADRTTGYEQGSIFLTATASDADGDAISSYTWTQLDGPPGEFLPSTDNGREFWAPAVSADTEIHLRVQALDARGAAGSAEITVKLLAYHRVSGVISSSTTWSSADGRPLLITEPVLVPKGVTLTVAAGTIVRSLSADASNQDPSLAVRGTLDVQGSAVVPVFFESVNPLHVQWQGISFSGTMPSATLKYVVIDHAVVGLDLDSAPSLSLSDVLIRDCELGIGNGGFYQATSMQRLTLLRNQVGLDLRTIGNSSVSNSVFRDNALAVSGLYTGGTLSFSGNNFTGTGRTMVAPINCCGLGTITATQNYWGSTDAVEIGTHITDNNDSPGLTGISFQPFLNSANADAGARIDPAIISLPSYD